MIKLLIFLILIKFSLCWDYNLYVQLWPPSWIYPDKINYYFTNDYFTNHGIWMQNYNGSYPENCNYTQKDKFNISKVSTIYNNLTKYWTNFINPIELWEHEYYKHMLCAIDTYSNIYKLFYFGLLFRDKYNIYKLLSNNNIYPNNTTYYNLLEFNTIIKTNYNATIIITCNKDNILNEIRFCLTKEFQLFNCPENLFKDECKSSLIKYLYLYNNNK